MWVNMKRMKGWKNSGGDEKSGKSIHQAGSDDEYKHILCHADYQSKKEKLLPFSELSFLYFLLFIFIHRLLLFNNFYQHNAFFCCGIEFLIKFIFPMVSIFFRCHENNNNNNKIMPTMEKREEKQ